MKAYLTFLLTMTHNLLSHGRELLALAKFEYALQSKTLFLGSLWNLLQPLTQIGVYWLVFGLGLRNGAAVDGVPYVSWLTAGVAMWTWFNRSIPYAAGTLSNKATVLIHANVPLYWIPVSSVLAEARQALWSLLLLTLVCLTNGWLPSLHTLWLFYYFVCTLFFLFGVSFISSILVLFARDFQKLLQMAMRFLFFLSPVFWQPNQNLPLFFQYFNRWNPFAYLIDGIRQTLFATTTPLSNPSAMLRFWLVALLCYGIGAGLQKRVDRNLLDFL